MNGLFQETRNAEFYKTHLLSRHWISEDAFEIRFTRPPLFQFAPGQRVRFMQNDIERDYTPVSSPKEENIDFLVKSVKGGLFSSALASAQEGASFRFTGPHGYFRFYPSERVPVFAATGTGIAPFVSMARTGVKNFILLHGVRRSSDLYYESLFRKTATLYVPCLSAVEPHRQEPVAAALRRNPPKLQSSFAKASDFAQASPDRSEDTRIPPRPGDRGFVRRRVKDAKEGVAGAFAGRVTVYLLDHLASGAYDFYLCGNAKMIRDVILLVDQKFPDLLVYTETFY
jgi:ferredoxin-NADP reductase